MLKINSREYVVDRKLFEDTIGVDGFDMYIDMKKYALLEAEVAARYYTAEVLLEERIRFITYGAYKNVNPQAVSAVLEDYFNIESLGFLQKTSRGISLSMEKVIHPLREHCRKYVAKRPIFYSMVIDFCNLYEDYSTLKHFSESLSAKKKLIMPTDEVDNFDNKLYKISSLYTRQSTGRYYTKYDNLQGWNLESVHTFTAPKDYFFVWADFDQIDLRVAANLVLFNGHPEVIEQFNNTPDKYEAIARIMSQKMERSFDEHKFKAIRSAYKTAILARLYGASKYTLMQDGFTDSQEIDMLDSYYKQHEYYQEYVSRFERAIAFNAAVMVEDYFGCVREIPIPQNDKARSRVLEQCLNTPIQSTSNNIVMLWVNELTKAFRSHGFGYDKFRVALCRHDESVFLVHKDCIPCLWLFELCGSIYIDSWSELTAKPEFGYNYGVVDDELTELFNSSVHENREWLMEPKEQIAPNKNWLPCQSVARATFFAPMSPPVFAQTILSFDPNWAVDAQVLKDKIDNRAPDTVAFAKSLITSYKEQAAEGKEHLTSILEYIDNYNKYYSYCIVEVLGSKKKDKVPVKEFLSYLKEHGVGYVYAYNVLTETYAVVDGIQIKYSKDVYTDIIKELDTYGC